MAEQIVLVRRPRAALVATLTTVALSGLSVAGGFVARRIAEQDLGSDDFIGRTVLSEVRPFLGDPFADFRMEQWLPWLVGLAVALAVCWPITWLTARKGVLSAFVGTWFATVAAAAAGTLASAWVWADQNPLPEGLGLSQFYADAVDPGLHWGFLFGWAPALIAALLTAVLRTRPESEDSADGEDSDSDESVSTLDSRDSEPLPALSFAG